MAVTLVTSTFLNRILKESMSPKKKRIPALVLYDAVHLNLGKFYLEENENMDTTSIPRSQVMGEVEPGLQLEDEDRNFINKSKSHAHLINSICDHHQS